MERTLTLGEREALFVHSIIRGGVSLRLYIMYMPKQVMPKIQELSRSLEIELISTFDTEFPTIFNKTCT